MPSKNEAGKSRQVDWTRLTIMLVGCGVSMWPFYGIEYFDINKLTNALLPIFPMFAGFLVLALTLQRDAGWLQRQNWRRVNVERRLAEKDINVQIVMLGFYIVSFVIMIVHSGLSNSNSRFAIYLSYVYLILATAALYMTLFLPIMIRRMRVMPYDDLIEEKLERRSVG